MIAGFYIKKNLFVKLCVFILLFLYVFTPPIKIIPFSPLYIITLVSIVYTILKFKRFVIFFSSQNYILIAFQFLFLFIYALLMDVFTNYQNNVPLSRKYVINILLLSTNFFFTSFFFLDIIKRKITCDSLKIINIFFALSLFQSLVVIIMILNPELREYVFHDLLSFEDKKIFRPDLWIKRSYGLSSQFLFAMPLYQGIGIIIAYIFSIKYDYKYLFYIPFLLISILFNARIGIVALPLIIIIHGSLSFFSFKTKDILKSFKIIFLMALFMSILVISVVNFFDLSYFQSTLMWLYETFDDSGQAENINILKNHIFLPDKPSGVLFGQGRYLTMNRAETFNSDIGYVNYLFFGGLLFSLILYIIIIEISLLAYLNSENIYERSIVIAIFFLVIVANFKGVAFTSNSFITAFFIINLAISNKTKLKVKNE